MSNHVHLLVQTSSTPLAPFMKKINMNYAIYFNKKYESVGHLNQGRYNAEMIKDRGHLLMTSRYIHLYPVEANIVKYPDQYPHSNYRTFIGKEKCKLTNAGPVLARFNHEDSTMTYEEFVKKGLSLSSSKKSCDIIDSGD